MPEGKIMTSSEYPGPRSRAVIWGTAAEGNNPFQRLAPTTVAFATRPILESFNWSDCVAGVEAGSWYLVAFRSVRRATADIATLMKYDDRAYTEAFNAGGLLYY